MADISSTFYDWGLMSVRTSELALFVNLGMLILSYRFKTLENDSNNNIHVVNVPILN